MGKITLFENIMTLGVSTAVGPVSYITGIKELQAIGSVCTFLARLCCTRESVQILMKRNFGKRILDFGMKQAELSKVLVETRGIIGGSVMLQCAEGDFYTNDRSSDIDMYIPARARVKIANYIKVCGYLHDSDEDNLAGSLNNDFTNQLIIEGSYVYYHGKTGRKIDLLVICPDISSPKEAIGAYDFTFLMNLYDGKEFQLWFPKDIVRKNGRYNPVNNPSYYSYMMS